MRGGDGADAGAAAAAVSGGWAVLGPPLESGVRDHAVWAACPAVGALRPERNGAARATGGRRVLSFGSFSAARSFVYAGPARPSGFFG